MPSVRVIALITQETPLTLRTARDRAGNSTRACPRVLPLRDDRQIADGRERQLRVNCRGCLARPKARGARFRGTSLGRNDLTPEFSRER